MLVSFAHSLRLSRIFAALAVIVILVASLVPAPPRTGLPYFDKIEHLAAYVVLGFLLFLATGKKGAAIVLASVGFCAVYGGLIEIIQPFFGRQRELADWMVDIAGATVGSLAGAPARRLLDRIAVAG